MLKIRKKLAEKKEASKGIAKAGFTLIELLVVLAILAILVLLAAPRFLGYTKDANVSAMQADAKVLANAALVYNVESDDNSWPVAEGASAIAKFEQGAEEFEVVAINETELSKQVQSIKGDYSEYGILIDEGSSRQGSVYRIGEYDKKTDTLGISTEKAGVADKDGDKHFGVDLVDVDETTGDEVTVTDLRTP